MSNKDLFFEREIIAAAGASSLEEARKDWQWISGGFHASVTHCQLCHTPIKHFASIGNTKTGVILTIGFDCLTKLEKFQSGGKIEPVRDVLRREYEAHVDKTIGDRKVVAAMTKWLRGQQGLPEGVIRTLRFLERIRIPDSIQGVEAMVEYYKSHRRFDPLLLLNQREKNMLEKSLHRRFLSRNITLTELPRYRIALERGFILARRAIEWRKDREAEAKKLERGQLESCYTEGVPFQVMRIGILPLRMAPNDCEIEALADIGGLGKYQVTLTMSRLVREVHAGCLRNAMPEKVRFRVVVHNATTKFIRGVVHPIDAEVWAKRAHELLLTWIPVVPRPDK